MLVVQGVRVHLLEEGSGPPVLLLHGNPDTSELWRGVTSRLKERYRCLAPDLPGFGASALTSGFDCGL